MKIRIVFLSLILSSGMFINNSFAQRNMEKLNRGIVAVRGSSSEVLVSWRILGDEYAEGATYNLYRNSTLIASGLETSNYQDETSTDYSYQVAAVINGTEQSLSDAVTPWSSFYKTISLTKPDGGTTPDGDSFEYEPNDASVGDLDGDGDYEIVLKWQPDNAADNSSSGYTGNTILEALEMDGTSLWTIDLGINIRSGAHYTQFIVYDLDSDGDAEIVCKTADGTEDGTGNIIGDSDADYRNSSGYILEGPEYLTVFSGETGEEITTVDYVPERGTVSDWGDSYGNRVDRFLACVAYLDGTTPSVVMCRGYYTRITLTAWDFDGSNLTERWAFDTDDGYSTYEAQGNHNLAVGDVDDDGKDEIMYGSCAIDDDGTGLYNTGYGHGDAGHLSDINPNSDGLEYFMCHETADGSSIPGLSLRNAATGSMQFEYWCSGDIGRGVAFDIDPNYEGMEIWGSNGSGIYTCEGDFITSTYPTTAGGANTYNFGVWWDGDVLRELLDKTVITKWDYDNQSTDRVLTLYNYDVQSNNSSKSNPCLSADIFGDWREEIILRNTDDDALVIFSTPEYTDQRMYTLMHDPIYRLSIAWQNVGYNQPPHLGFYFGADMDTPPDPDINIISGSSDDSESASIDLTATAGNGYVELSWDYNNISTESVSVYRDTDSDPSGRTRIDVVSYSTTTYTDESVTNGTTYYYWIKATLSDGTIINSDAAEATPSSSYSYSNFSKASGENLEGNSMEKSTTSISDNSLTSNVSVYPNPVNDVLHVNATNGTISLYNVTGGKIYEETVKTNNNEIDFSGYSKGIYLLQVKDNDEIFIQKVIKE